MIKYGACLLLALALIQIWMDPSAAGQEREQISFQSVDVGLPKDLLQDSVLRDTEVSGTLVLPEGIPGALPVMIIVHGSGGVGKAHWDYAKSLNEAGIGAFIIDSFKPRGIRSTVGAQLKLTLTTMVADALHALTRLSRHQRIDPERIGIMGTSRGGSVARLTAFRPVQAKIAGPLRFAVHVAIYPGCIVEPKNPAQLTGAPMLFQLGALDDYTSPGNCLTFVERAKAAGFPAEAIVYPDAHHGWTGKVGSRRLKKAISWRDCSIHLDDDGPSYDGNGGTRLDSLKDIKTALGRCAKPGGATVAGNDAVKQQALTDLMAFLGQNLALR